MRLVVTVEEVKGRCPVYRIGDRVVLNDGYRMDLEETTAVCLHGLASLIPYHVAFAKGVKPSECGLAHKDRADGRGYIQCLDPCDYTGGGTVVFSIAVEK
jgi:uncharacterized repeat protein (TIGR04076 family)